MKKVLLFLSFFTLWTSISKLNAQCTISNVHITPRNVNTANGVCIATVDLDYTVALNSGSKHTVIHLWELTKYPNPANKASDYPLATAATGTMIGTIIIDYQQVATPKILTSWPTGSSDFKSGTTPSTPILVPAGFSVSKVGTNTVVSFTNLKLPLSSCNQPVTIKGDVWATQNDQNASCLSSSVISVVANDPVINGLLTCNASPRTFSASFKTFNSTSLTFSVYKDSNGNGVFDSDDQTAGKLNLSGGSLSSPNSNITVTNGTDVTINTQANVVFNLSNITYDQQTPGSKFSIFIVARVSGNNYDNVLRIDNSCAALPVVFKSFSGVRNNQTVSLKWETATEQNNRGFYVQRNTNGEWKDVAFVFSRADNGNSNGVLSYVYNDPNNVSGVSYYRILQVDLDGKGRYSDIITVKGNGQASKLLLFPNPGVSGKINLQFDDESSVRTVTVYDATGTLIKTFRNFVGSHLSIDRLKPGMYNVQVTNVNSQSTVSDKFVIQN